MFNMKWGIMAGAAALLLSLIVGIASGTGFATAIVRAALFGGAFFGIGLGAYKLINSFIPELLFSDGNSTGAEPSGFSAPAPGARVNITLGDTSGAALPDPHDDSENSDEVGNIADLVSGAVKSAKKKAPVNLPPLGIDQKLQAGYTEKGGGTVDSEPFTGGGLDIGAGLAGGDTGSVAGSSVAGNAHGSADIVTGAEAGGGTAADFGKPDSAGGLDSDSGIGSLPDLDGMAGSFTAGAAMPEPEHNSFDSSVLDRKSTGSKAPKGFDSDFNPKEIAAGLRTVLSKDK
jgi:hypothetical protein